MVGNIPLLPQLNEFFKELYGNDDQLELAKQFCSSTQVVGQEQNVTCYDALLEKANQLVGAMRGRQLFVGGEDYWQALGIEAPIQIPITAENIDRLLNESKFFLREISSLVERSSEQEARHSEAYYYIARC